jgi:thiol:disulfide interchange protein
LIIFAGIYFVGTKIYQRFANNKERRKIFSGFVIILIGCSMLINQFVGMEKENTNQELFADNQSLFTQIMSIENLDQNLTTASKENKITLLYFTADWCVSCRQLERETFADEALIGLLAEINTVKADVSLNNERDKALMSKYSIFGPPTILIFNTGGEEQKNLRKIGVTKADELLNDLNRLRDTQAKLLGANL